MAPSGRDYGRLEANLGGALERSRAGRISIRSNDRLWRGDDPLPVPTADGVADAVTSGMSWRQRSVIGRIWALAGRAPDLTDRELATELRRFRGETFRVIDPRTGEVVRRPLLTDPTSFRAFARSPDARQEREISPRVVGAPQGDVP
jgi:hypothetical protein